MARSGQTSHKVSKVAGKLLKTGTGTKKQVREVAGSDLEQARRKKKGR